MNRSQMKVVGISMWVVAPLLGLAVEFWHWSIVATMFAGPMAAFILLELGFALYNEPPQRFVRWREDRRRRGGGGRSDQPPRERGAPLKAPRVSSR
jgi:hypothetical protein